MQQGGAADASCPNGSANGSTLAGAADGSGAVQITASELLASLDGNLCRCTGWRPIADMAKVDECAV